MFTGNRLKDHFEKPASSVRTLLLGLGAQPPVCDACNSSNIGTTCPNIGMQYMHVCRPMPAITFKEGYDIIFASSLRGNSAGPLGVVTFGVGSDSSAMHR
ncbi:uncharacterized protein H6S33_002011 [Morchella sextelata]|uniref:uncharacterized protein n=1 Tax=Morchella sextelata TaxID=1174677 RepID=UPI001D0381A1|nr:uncharacterized protein H6S33_002011 [Morchella sextelata]KAH0607959.1 hypothetical protein H6S33_002011 [Morchella sextelata]